MIDDIWQVIVVLEIFTMQLGFMMIEVGTIRFKNQRSVIYKNLLDIFMVAVTFWGLGYGISVGATGGLHGKGGFFDREFDEKSFNQWILGYCFCCSTCTIVSGALAERTFIDTYLAYSFVMSSLIYPVISCWAWGGGWLQGLGFHDHGGSGVVHLTAGISGMIGTIFLGPRIGYLK